jgi:S-adenosylmethionine:tRNA ribosyltransferase-isomerase
MVSRKTGDLITHARFRHFPDYVVRGDVVVVNTSATFNASLDGRRQISNEEVELHLSTPVPGSPDNQWVVELRRFAAGGTVPLLDARAEEVVGLAAGGSAVLLEPYRPLPSRRAGGTRLWTAELRVPGGVMAYADLHGSPIRYGYVPERWPLSYYQTIFAGESGSAEMPSAGRPFTAAVLDRLERIGVTIAPVVLHTGVASLEEEELPYPERFRVPAGTAEAVNRARAEGHRVVAVGTTVVRALETLASTDGRVDDGEGWTDLVVTPDRGVRAVDAILTGWHEPRSSHLAMLEALAGRSHLDLAYQAALEGGYLWHEFGDVHLILP